MEKRPLINEAYKVNATWATDFRVLKAMFFADVKGNTQQERLESFYLTQADVYDSYRFRMLHGRLPMIKAMPAPKNSCWVDLGGGTGSNLEFYGDSGLSHFSKVVVLDLCPSLVNTAKTRVESHNGWSQIVDVVLGDACDYDNPDLPKAGTVDCVTFSYALTMIPDWEKAIKNAFRLLKPGGHIAVCDFTINRKEQWFGMAEFWTWLFSNDHVHLREEHVLVLQTAFEQVDLQRGFGTFPYVPSCLKAPWYSFVGKKTCKTFPNLH
jgi:S-adenosylmethionine-diacylgycerolhomoserine-N-methlytransferase